MADDAGIPHPQPSDLTRAFWDGCRAQELRVQCCAHCGSRFFPPLPACPACQSQEWRWVRSQGTGTLYSFTVVHRPARPNRATPYVVGVVDLDDGWTMMSNIVDCDQNALFCGERVTVRFQSISDDVTLPMFTPLKP